MNMSEKEIRFRFESKTSKAKINTIVKKPNKIKISFTYYFMRCAVIFTPRGIKTQNIPGP
jgi:hypothetical protein